MNKNILKEELIGTHVLISDAKTKDLIGINGTIVDETKNTISIKTTKGIKKILKQTVFLKIGKVIIDGSFLLGRSEERIKK